MADVLMPQMGESIVEGTLTKWLKKVGDRVERDEPLFEISTDKVDTEIPSPASGTLTEILVQEGATVAINTLVARVGSGAAQAAAAPAAPVVVAAPAMAAPTDAGEPSGGNGGGAGAPGTGGAAPAMAIAEPIDDLASPVSPLVRRMARENDIDLKLVKGTGAGGRITKQDLENLLAARTAASAPAAAPDATPLPRVSPPKTKVEPMSSMRQKIAEHMVVSKRTSAHVTTVHRVDVTKVAKLRDRIKGEFQQRYGYSLTFLPFFARAAAEALRQFPIVNSSIEGTNILYHNEINVGIAVALDNGLIVPVIKHADEMNIVGLQRAIVDLAARARGKQLKPDEVQGGTFSITNFGSFGSIFATPVINQPQVAILGVGAVEKQPVVIDDAIAIRSMAHLALTFDHRLIDGALADQFCQKVKAVLENWSDQVL
jgi:pyruvate dehydrogenase E2 component (dihydrolipoamide acetyltransferase)